ncbi:MAG: ribonuclease HI family protein, partial [Candidatus Dormibacteraeota bacterium]|nr:ribonuclease HI family protein [Candidatus Dormibacteraeota bacterium]
VLMRPSLVVIDEISEAIGWVEDHHEAEYRALIAGLRMARRHKIDRIRVFLDSMLVVNSVDGPWRVRPKHLSALCDQARGLLGEFVDIKLAWVPRKWNAKADARASKALG